MSTYRIGTVTVSNGSTSVNGSGTSWVAAGVREGDFLFVNGLFGEVASVQSNTALTLVRGWPGSNASGQQYSIALIDDGQRSIASLNQVLQALGSGTLTSLAGLSAGANQMPYFTGAGVMALTNLTAAARTLLGRATIETQSATDTTAGRLLKTRDAGMLLPLNSSAPELQDAHTAPSGFYRLSGNSTNAPFTSGTVLVMHQQSGRSFVLFFNNVTGQVVIRRRHNDVWGADRTLWHTGNTTVDSNGFVKQASPIVRLFNDGFEAPLEPVGAQFERLDVGLYRLSDVEPLADTGWQIEVPQDHNGNRLVFVEASYDATARTLTVSTSEPAWSGAWVAGDAKDIPSGRWVDLRFQDAASE